MTMTAVPMRVALSAIDVGENVRELDQDPRRCAGALDRA
jgi:hypothetical protein